jgi:hypothetical protein
MERRRALLAGGGNDGYIYKPGFTAWKNVESATTVGSITVAFGTDSVTATAGTTSSTIKVNLLISEETYGKFSNLVFTAKYTGSGGNPKITWQNVASSSIKKETGLSSTTTAKTFSVDISTSTGDYYISIAPYMKNGVITIYDMHFE